MARPFNNEVTKKHDRIIAKVYMQLYRWGFSSLVFEKLIAKAAHKTLGRARLTQTGDLPSDEDILSVESIKKIYETWSTDEKNKSYFARINYSKTFLKSTAPKEEHLDRVISFFMEYMGQEPEQCIFETPPKCPDDMLRDGIGWRFFNGELDGDSVLAPKAIKRLATYPKIRKRPAIRPKIKK
jgi:hypothetical protein